MYARDTTQPIDLWRDADIKNIIANDLYVGRLQYAVNSKSPYLRGLDPIYTYRSELRIVSDEIFERNQKLLDLRRKIPHQTKSSPHLFSGVLRCPHCSAVMNGKAQTLQLKTKTNVKLSYGCSLYQQSGPRGLQGLLDE